MSNFRFNLCDISLSKKEEKVPYIRQNIYRLPLRYIKLLNQSENTFLILTKLVSNDFALHLVQLLSKLKIWNIFLFYKKTMKNEFCVLKLYSCIIWHICCHVPWNYIILGNLGHSSVHTKKGLGLTISLCPELYISYLLTIVYMYYTFCVVYILYYRDLDPSYFKKKFLFLIGT